MDNLCTVLKLAVKLVPEGRDNTDGWPCNSNLNMGGGGGPKMAEE